MPQEIFVRELGSLFEHSPWVAERAWSQRPFASPESLQNALCQALRESDQEKQLALIRAHPDLVGRATLTSESQGEQTAAGLMDLSPGEIALFQTFNAQYKERFAFPFVICARLNKKEAILEAFPRRLKNDSITEISTALSEIEKIARLRLADILAQS